MVLALICVAVHVLITSAATEEKTFCAEKLSDWDPFSPWKFRTLTLSWNPTKSINYGYGDTAAPFQIFGTPSSTRGSKGPLCEIADQIPWEPASNLARAFLCGDCIDGCESKCYPDKIHDEEICEITVRTECVHLSGAVPETMKAEWRRDVDMWRIAMAIGGAFLVSFATPLSRSKVVHSLVGASLGMFLAITIVLWWTWSQAKNTIPFARYYLALVNAFIVVFPSLAFFLFSSFAPPLSTGLVLFEKFLVYQEPYFGIPIGAVIVAFITLMGIYAGNRVFKSEEITDGSEVEFKIGADGKRIDLLPGPPNAQVGLEWALWLTGLAFMYRCSEEKAINFAWIAIVFMWNTLVHYINLGIMFGRQANITPQFLQRSLMSKEDYCRTAQQETELALAKLRAHLKESGVKYYSVIGNSDRELRLRRFTEGGSHVDNVPTIEWEPASGKSGIFSCSVM